MKEDKDDALERASGVDTSRSAIERRYNTERSNDKKKKIIIIIMETVEKLKN